MTLKIEEGKFYQNRMGHRRGPMRPLPHNIYKWADGNSATYTATGSSLASGSSPMDLVAEWALGPGEAVEIPVDVDPRTLSFPTTDIKKDLADEAVRIVTGARRSAYGRPEMNFERIARFWNAYLINAGHVDAEVLTAADVSPMLRLLKEARLCETPDHRDSFVDLIGYTLTGAEVNGLSPVDTSKV